MDLRAFGSSGAGAKAARSYPGFLVPEGAGEGNARPMSRRAGQGNPQGKPQGAATGEPGRPPFRITPEGRRTRQAARPRSVPLLAIPVAR